MDPARPAPHRLVDGKFLALSCIVTGRYFAGRELQTSDIGALDDYIHRCKLGPYRPGRALTLAGAAKSGSPEQREAAQKVRQTGRQHHKSFINRLSIKVYL